MKEESLIDDKYKLATQNFKNNNFQLAEKIYKEILQTKPNHLESLCYLGLLYIQSKKFNLAKTLFLKASEINPNNPSINNNLGSILFNLGDYQNAIKFYEKAINFQPNFEDAYFNLGIIFNLLGDYNKSFNSLEEWILPVGLLGLFKIRIFCPLSNTLHVLSNSERKQTYDNFGHAAFENSGGGRGGFGNFDFSSHF